jgi:DNA-binding response OmpR family regulator
VRLLLVEDNERFAALLKKGLGRSGFAVDIIATADDATAALKSGRWDIVVLDLGLPDADGLDVLTDLRRRADTTPVLILSARGTLRDRIVGFEAGADDYLVKPFAFEELVARLQALLRRPGHLLGLALKVGNLSLDTVARQVFVADKPIVFPARELAVLEHLLRHSGKVVAKSQLENAVYGPMQEVTSNAVEVHLHRLRQRLIEVGASVRVHTVRGVGYMIREDRLVGSD